MKMGFKAGLMVILAVLGLLTGGCLGGSPSPDATLELPSGRKPNASVSGTVTYREGIALTPGAQLVVDLRDVSLADAPAPLIARQTIPNPGQVPIRFKVEYNRDDISPRNTYSVQADIVESDGRLAFTNDTRTRSSPTATPAGSIWSSPWCSRPQKWRKRLGRTGAPGLKPRPGSPGPT